MKKQSKSDLITQMRIIILEKYFDILGELQKAKSCHQKAIEINPNNASAHNNLGEVFRHIGRTSKSKKLLIKKQLKLILIMQNRIIILE